jgi:hypothetical protein
VHFSAHQILRSYSVVKSFFYIVLYGHSLELLFCVVVLCCCFVLLFCVVVLCCSLWWLRALCRRTFTFAVVKGRVECSGMGKR